MADDDHDQDEKNPIDAALELFVYAPLGLALTARENLPDFVAKGRSQFESQVNLARMMGQYAVKEGSKEGRRRWAEVSETLAGLGLLPQPPKPTPPQEPAFRHEPSPDDGFVPESQGGGGATGNGKAEPAGPRPSSEGLAIPGYDTLSASQVVQRLAGLSTDELEAVRAYEAATRGRRTILSKIGQLQTPNPS